jgi:hypothetical protein
MLSNLFSYRTRTPTYRARVIALACSAALLAPVAAHAQLSMKKDKGQGLHGYPGMSSSMSGNRSSGTGGGSGFGSGGSGGLGSNGGSGMSNGSRGMSRSSAQGPGSSGANGNASASNARGSNGPGGNARGAAQGSNATAADSNDQTLKGGPYKRSRPSGSSMASAAGDMKKLNKKPKADAPHSQFDYTYGSDGAAGGTSDSLYGANWKAPYENYQWGSDQAAGTGSR